MARIGLVNSVYEAAANIDLGRKGFAARGKAEEGRISYEDGIATALSAFKEAQCTSDPQTIILVEYTFPNSRIAVLLQNFVFIRVIR